MHTEPNLSLKETIITSTYAWRPAGPQLCFVFIQKGNLEYRSEGYSQWLEPGSVLIYSNNTRGTLCAGEGGSCTVKFFMLGFENLASLVQLGEISLLKKLATKGNSVRFHPANTPLAAQTRAILSATPAEKGLEQRGHLLALAAKLLSQEFEQAQRNGGQTGETHSSTGEESDISKLIGKLSLDDVQNLSVEDLAQKLGCSRRHLNRLFREHLGTSVAALKMEVRLLRAVSLLRNPQTKVIDVAEGCGFSHIGLFGQCFKKRFGASPNEWRKQQLSRNARKIVDMLREDCDMLCRGMCPWHNVQKAANGKPAKGNCAQEALTIRG